MSFDGKIKVPTGKEIAGDLISQLGQLRSEAKETDAAIDGVKQSADEAAKSFDKMGSSAETALKKTSKQSTNSEYKYMTNDEKFNYFTNSSRSSARKYLTSEQEALNNLTKAWQDYTQKVEAAGKATSAATLNDDKELKSTANVVYAWANSYKALGGDIDAVSDKMQLFMSEFAKTKNARSYETMFGEGTFRNMYSALDELTKAGYSIDSLFGKVFDNLTADAQKFVTTLGLANNASYFDKQAADAARLEAELQKVNEQQKKAFSERKASSVVGLDAQSIQPLVDGLAKVVEYMDKMYTLSIETGQALKALPETMSGTSKTTFASDGLTAMKTYREQIRALKSDIGGIVDILAANPSIVKGGNLTTTLFGLDYEGETNRIKKMADKIEYLVKLKEQLVTGMNQAGYTGMIPTAYEQTVAAQSEQIKASYEAQRAAAEQSSAQTATIAKEAQVVAENISLSAEQAEKLTAALSSSAEASKQVFSSGTFNTDGLALEKTLQAVKSISIEIVKYLSQINDKILSSADAEALLAAKAEQAATAIASQGAAADSVIDDMEEVEEAEQKIKLTGDQIIAQQRQLNELLTANGYGRFSTSVSKNGKIVIDNFEKEGQAANRAIVEFKNLEAAMNSINNGTLRSKISRSSSTVDEEKYVKDLTAALIEEYRIKSEFEKIKDPNAAQIAAKNKEIEKIQETIAALKEEGKAYSNVAALNEKATANAYSKAGYKYDLKNNNNVGTTTANTLATSYSAAIDKANQLKAATDTYTPQAIQRVNAEVAKLIEQLQRSGVVVTDSGADFSKVQQINAESVKKTIKAIDTLTSKMADADKIYSKSGKAIGSLGKDTPIGSGQYYREISQYAAQALNVDEANIKWAKSGNALIGTFRNQDKELQKVRVSAQEMGGAIRMSVSDIQEMSLAEKWLSPLTTKLKQLTVYFSSFTLVMGFINAVKGGVASVKELNTALTEFQVVTSASDKELQQFADDAKDVAKTVASTTADVVSSAVDWSRLGYNASDSLQLAKESAELAKVGFMDVDNATSALTASLQGFFSGTENATARSKEIVDVLVQVGNTMPIASDELATGLSNAGGVLAQAGNSLQESAALLTAGNAALQDAATVASSLRVLSMRLMGTSASKLSEAGEDVDGLIEDGSKLRKTIMDLTKTQKNAQGVDILTKTGDYKSTYEIKYMSPYTEMYMRCA